MDNIKFSLFDIFAYTLPGLIILLAIAILLDTTVVHLIDLIPRLQNISFSTGIVALAIGYIIGFAIDTPGTWLYTSIGWKLWGRAYRPEENTPPGFPKKRALVREYSPENSSFVHLWKVIKTMSHNLSFASLVLMSVSIFKVFRSPAWDEWTILAITAFIFAILFLHRALVFDRWHYRALSEIVAALHLEKRALKDAALSSKKE